MRIARSRILNGSYRASSLSNKKCWMLVLVALLLDETCSLATPSTKSVASNNPSTSSTAASSITIRLVETPSDVIALGNLRYDQWISQDFSHDTATTQPSPMAFRMATAEIHAERAAEGAVSFLAWRDNTAAAAVGAAELSPIELQNCLPSPQNIHDNCLYCYITDVVTSTAYRRQGIADQLMHHCEQQAQDWADQADTITTVILLLHVKPNNTGALQFYEKLGYQIVTNSKDNLPSWLLALDQEKLAANAGVSSEQLLLSKELELLN